MKYISRLFAVVAALTLLVAGPAAAQNFSSISVLNGSAASPSMAFYNDTNTGFYRVSEGVIGIAADGVQVAKFDSTGLVVTNSTGLSYSSTFTATGSRQLLSGDLTVSGTPGHAGGYLAGIMGNILGTSITGTGNSNMAGVQGKYDISGTNSSTHAKGAVVGEVGDNTTSADGAFVAVLGGDSNTTSARAAFTVDYQNSIAASKFDYGMDLQGPGAHNNYQAVSYNLAPVRIVSDVVILTPAAGAPSDGVSGTGAGTAGPGSLYVNLTTGKWYSNTNTKASPTWVLVATP